MAEVHEQPEERQRLSRQLLFFHFSFFLAGILVPDAPWYVLTLQWLGFVGQGCIVYFYHIQEIIDLANNNDDIGPTDMT